MLRVHVAYVQGKGSDWLPPTLAAIISKRKKVAGAAATTRHASNSSNGEGGIMWKFREAVCLELRTRYRLRGRPGGKCYNHHRTSAKSRNQAAETKSSVVKFARLRLFRGREGADRRSPSPDSSPLQRSCVSAPDAALVRKGSSTLSVALPALDNRVQFQEVNI